MSIVVVKREKDECAPVHVKETNILGKVKEEPSDDLLIEVNEFQIFKSEVWIPTPASPSDSAKSRNRTKKLTRRRAALGIKLTESELDEFEQKVLDVQCVEKKNTCRKSTSKAFPLKLNETSGSETVECPSNSDYEESSPSKRATKKLTEEQIIARRRRNALSLRKRRKQMTPEQKERQKKRDLIRKRRAEAALTTEEKIERRRKATLYMKELRQRKTPEETKLRRLKDLERKNAGKANLTEQQNEIRRRRNRDFMRVRRALLSAEEAALHREQNRVRAKERRKKETPLDKEALRISKKKWRDRQKAIIAEMSSEDYTDLEEKWKKEERIVEISSENED